MAYDMGRQLYILRKKRNLTQMDLAQMIGNTTRSDISAWERGTDYPSEDQFTALCNAFDVSKEFFLGATINTNPKSATQTDLDNHFSALTQENQRRLLRFAKNLMALQRDEQTVYSEERLVEREAARKRAASLPEGHERIRCSFCGKPQVQCDRLVAGNDSYICDECIRLCNQILDEPFDD